MESLIGATYLCNGIEVARDLVMRLVGPLLADAEVLGAGTDWKTNIQEIGRRPPPGRHTSTTSPAPVRTTTVPMWPAC